MKLILAFVHLGSNPSHTLNWYAEICRIKLPDCEVVLITDSPGSHFDFPGKVIGTQKSYPSSGISKFLRLNKAYKSVSGGYWRYTTERIFVLNELANYFDLNSPIVHIESDVLLTATQEMLLEATKKISKTSIVRYSVESGIASILIAPTLGQLTADLQELDKILVSNPQTRSDMSLLGLGLKADVLGELPRYSDENWRIEQSDNSYRVFDGAAIGQYLFGLDPVHTGNKQISGFLNENFDLPLDRCIWRIKTLDSGSQAQLFIEYRDCTLIPLCIHIHSKILIGPPNELDPQWIRYLQEANGDSARTRGTFFKDEIHSKGISLLNRIRLKISRQRWERRNMS